MTFRTLGMVRCLALSWVLSSVQIQPIHSRSSDHRLQTTFPPEFAKSVEFVFNHGIPNISGLEFHEIVLPKKGNIKVSGWVIPATDTTPQRVVCWNGLVYEGAEIGPKLDLVKYVSDDKRADYNPYQKIDRRQYMLSNARTALGVAILYRLGQEPLAHRLAKRAWIPEEKLAFSVCDTALWFHYNEAVEAFAGDDDQLAIMETQWVIENADSFVKQGAHPDLQWEMPIKTVISLNLEAQRRAKLQAKTPFNAIENRKLPLDDQVKNLITRLEEVEYEANMTMIDIGTVSSIYQEAKTVGGPMLEALVQCAESDTRMTRRLQYFPIRSWQNPFVTPSQLALRLISQITALAELPRSGDGKTDIVALTEMATATKAMSVEDRMVWILANDKWSLRMWVQASRHLAQNRTAKLSHASSEVTSLMSKRAIEVAKLYNPEKEVIWLGKTSFLYTPIGVHVEIAQNLAKWDLKGGLSTYQQLYTMSLANSESKLAQEDYRYRISRQRDLAQLAYLRAKAGDSKALAEYETRLIREMKKATDVILLARLSPLVEFPEWGDRMARQLFHMKDAVWLPTAQLARGNRQMLDEVLGSDLLKLPSVREYLIELLQDRAVVGEVWRQSDRGLVMKFTKSINPSMPSYVFMNGNDPRDPQPNIKTPLRVCDVVGYALTTYAGAPLFRPSWSVKDRDQALKDMIQYVRDCGNQLYVMHPKHSPNKPIEQVGLVFLAN